MAKWLNGKTNPFKRLAFFELINGVPLRVRLSAQSFTQTADPFRPLKGKPEPKQKQRGCHLNSQ